MGLYLCIFEGEAEVDGVDVGGYDDFGFFRDAVAKYLESGKPGSSYPTLMLHSDCDGDWSARECKQLGQELESISAAFRKTAPDPVYAGLAGAGRRIKETGTDMLVRLLHRYRRRATPRATFVAVRNGGRNWAADLFSVTPDRWGSRISGSGAKRGGAKTGRVRY